VVQDRFARVVVDVPARALATAFDYRIPQSLSGPVAIGCPVVVEFSGRKVIGWVVDVTTTTEYPDARDLLAVLGTPYFDAKSARLAEWIAAEYVAPLSEAVRLFLPPGSAFKLESTAVAEGEQWSLRRPPVRASSERWVTLLDAEYLPRKGAVVQQTVVAALSAGPMTTSELAEIAGAGAASAIRALQAAGVVEVESRRTFRRPDARAYAARRPESLSAGQLEALERIEAMVAGGGGTLLIEGVTGSGKTEVYMRAIDMVRAAGRQAIVLVPEISLTPQTVGRFRDRFGEKVAVLHSRLSAGERLDEWDRIREGLADIVVGARSALFAPIADVGLIIIDEEHESSFKQGSSPRYHAREVAERMASAVGATLVLGSATPSMESLHRAETGDYQRVLLPERVGGGARPEVTVVDMTAEFAEGHRSMFSRAMTARLADVAAEKTKAVLLLNRRGFASFLLCRECGHVPTCDSCSISMTFHQSGPSLACHHCASRRAVPTLCPECSSPYLRKFGAGTQRVEQELALLFPELPVVRMDADTTRGKGGHDRCLAEFEALESGVLLGTQMVAKGLDYPEVTLVGVMDADTILKLPDFRAAERTNQLLEQVAGRAGRGVATGHVVIQTYQPKHPAIQAVAAQDRAAFLAEERDARSELSYPPYGRLASVLLTGPDERVVRDAATTTAARLRQNLPAGVRILGPSAAPVARIQRAWRWYILVKAESGVDLPKFLRESLRSTAHKGVKMAVDVDCQDIV